MADGNLPGEDLRPSNIFPIWSVIEVAFDAFGIIVIPESNDEFRIIIINPALRGKLIKARGECQLKFDDLDGKLLEFKTAARPAKEGCHADVFRRTDGRTSGRSDDGRGGVHDLDAL
jgi:hypothetical protein